MTVLNFQARSLTVTVWVIILLARDSSSKMDKLKLRVYDVRSSERRNILIDSLLRYPPYPPSFSRTDTTDSGCSPFFFRISGFVLVPCGKLSWFLLAFDCTLISPIITYLLTYRYTWLIIPPPTVVAGGIIFYPWSFFLFFLLPQDLRDASTDREPF